MTKYKSLKYTETEYFQILFLKKLQLSYYQKKIPSKFLKKKKKAEF